MAVDMYPNNQTTNPVDYLNQIAPHAPKKTGILNKQPIITAVIGLLITIIIFMLISVMMSGGIKLTSRLAARLVNSETIAIDATKNIKSTQLRALNSDLKLYFTNTIRDIDPILAKDKISINKLDKQTLAIESVSKIASNLEDARLNAVYDRTYAREMAYQLGTLLTLMIQINKNSTNKDLNTFIDNSIKNLEPLQKRFADFNLATS